MEEDTTVRRNALPSLYLPQLDGLRAVAVLSVVVFHARTEFLPGGYIGVDVFFVLSGFLITQIIGTEIRRSGKFSFKNFYLRRALRLFRRCSYWPPCALAYWLIPNIPQASESLVGTAAAVTYSSSWIAATKAAELGTMLPTWSLSVEEHFYLVWPIVLILGLKLPVNWRWIAYSSLVFVIFFPVIMFFTFGWELERLYYAPDTRAGQLLIGCSAALLLHRVSLQISNLAALCSSLLLIAYAFFDGNLVPENFYSHGGIVVIPLLGIVVIIWVAQRSQGMVHRALSSRPMVWIGQRSYGIYLWNLPLIGALAFLGSSPGALVVKALICLLIPAASYTWVEKPFLKLKNRFYPKQQVKDGPNDAGPE